jgi:hypothetical protein
MVHAVKVEGEAEWKRIAHTVVAGDTGVCTSGADVMEREWNEIARVTEGVRAGAEQFRRSPARRAGDPTEQQGKDNQAQDGA